MRLFSRAIAVFGLSMLLSANPLQAQNLPGVSLEEAGLSVDIKNLFQLAQQAYPTLFANASGWRSHAGYTYQFYAASGIYAGVKDGNVFLLGGPFGTSIVQKGALTAAIGVLQDTVAKQQSSYSGSTGGTSTGTNAFTTVKEYKTLADLVAGFKLITYETTTTLGTLKTTGQYKLEYKGASTVNGEAASELLITITSSTGTVPFSMWVDGTGKILKLIHNISGIEYTPQSTAQTIGTGLVSSFLLSLAGSTSPTLTTAIADLKNNAAFSSHVTKKAVGKYNLDVLTVEITGATGDKLTWEVADFGSYSMVIRYSSVGKIGGSSLEALEVELR
jgi:hypothetical protein